MRQKCRARPTFRRLTVRISARCAHLLCAIRAVWARTSGEFDRVTDPEIASDLRREEDLASHEADPVACGVAEDSDDHAPSLSGGHIHLRAERDDPLKGFRDIRNLDVDGDEVVTRLAQADASVDARCAGPSTHSLGANLGVLRTVCLKVPFECLRVELRKFRCCGGVDLKVDNGESHGFSLSPRWRLGRSQSCTIRGNPKVNPGVGQAV